MPVAFRALRFASLAATPPPQSYNPVRGLTIEQAKQLRLIKPTKLVPEDFGADESTGAPKSGADIPTIRYATDSVRGRKPAPLPAELAQPATPQQQAIIQSLERAANQNPEDPNLLSSVTRNAVVEAIQAPPVPGFLPPPVLDPPPVPPLAQAPRRMVPPPIPTNPTPTQITVLPPPVLDEATESSMIVEEELTPTSPVPETQAEDLAEAARRLLPPPDADAITCPLCVGKSYGGTGVFLRHVRRYHAAREAELMAPYASA